MHCKSDGKRQEMVVYATTVSMALFYKKFNIE